MQSLALAILFGVPLTVLGNVALQLRGRQISTSGGGTALITDIGHSNSDALLCLSDLEGCCAGGTNWYLSYGQQEQKRVQSDDSVLGWLRNRGRNPGVVRLRSRTPNPQPGQSQEGVYTCEIVGDGVVSVGLYYPLDVQLSFHLNSLILSLSYTITCTVTGGSVLRSSFTGPGGVSLQPLSPVGVLGGRGQDTYVSSVTRTTGNHGDMFICTASNVASVGVANYTISAALPPTIVTWQQVALSVIRVEWAQPAGGATVRSYTVTALYGSGVVAAYLTVKARSRSVVLQGLVNDGRNYTVSVVAMSDHLPGMVTFTAALTQLTPPTLSFANVTSTTATLALSPPPTPPPLPPDHHLLTLSLITTEGGLGGCVPGNVNNVTLLVGPEESSITLNNLEEASTYIVTVQSLSSVLGNSSVSQPLSLNTSQAAPSEPPGNLRVIEVTSSSVYLQWDPLSSCVRVNGVPSGWEVQYWVSGDDPATPPLHVLVPGSPLVAREMDVVGLEPNTNYTFHVAAVTGQDLVGMFSNSISAVTLEDEGGKEGGPDKEEGSKVGESTGDGGSGGDGGPGLEADLHHFHFHIQIQFGPTDSCITWTDEKAYKVEADIQIAIRGYIVLQCPQCNDAIFQGQRGMFVCHDNPHMPTYRITLSHQTTPLVLYLIQQWVLLEPSLQVGWLLVKVNPEGSLEIPALDVAEQQVVMAPTNQTVSLPYSSLGLIEKCMTELQAVCNHTSS